MSRILISPRARSLKEQQLLAQTRYDCYTIQEAFAIVVSLHVDSSPNASFLMITLTATTVDTCQSSISNADIDSTAIIIGSSSSTKQQWNAIKYRRNCSIAKECNEWWRYFSIDHRHSILLINMDPFLLFDKHLIIIIRLIITLFTRKWHTQWISSTTYVQRSACISRLWWLE